ncbi:MULTISPECIES: hypothetical protein [unclassified Nonomuraea]|uniref:hypothetical protein n=1 Tax=unclassified Nonomuraea TaxID=2593643 RepID=UPI0033F3B7ED
MAGQAEDEVLGHRDGVQKVDAGQRSPWLYITPASVPAAVPDHRHTPMDTPMDEISIEWCQPADADVLAGE